MSAQALATPNETSGIDSLKIKIHGHWRGDTFQMYIHEQSSAFAADVSTLMSQQVEFRSIVGPRVPDE